MYACKELDSASNCIEWVHVIIGLPPITTEEMYLLGGAIATLLSLAFGAGILVRMLLNERASRHG